MPQSPFEMYQAQQASLAPQATKSAAAVSFENAYWSTYAQEMQKSAAAYENAQTEELFDIAFEEHTRKLASADPEYAAILQQNMQKAAFEQSYFQTLAALGVNQ